MNTTEEGKVFIKGLMEYFFELNNFDKQTEQKMNEVIENMQQPVQQKLMSLKEIYLNRGRQEGRQEGEQKKAVQVAKLLMLKYPQWPNESIVEITGLTVATIKKIREKLASPKNGRANGKANEKE